MTSSYNKLFPDTSNTSNAIADQFKELMARAEKWLPLVSARDTAVSTAQPAKRNALVHGVYSNEFVLPWESAEELKIYMPNFGWNGSRAAALRNMLFWI